MAVHMLLTLRYAPLSPRVALRSQPPGSWNLENLSAVKVSVLGSTWRLMGAEVAHWNSHL